MKKVQYIEGNLRRFVTLVESSTCNGALTIKNQETILTLTSLVISTVQKSNALILRAVRINALRVVARYQFLAIENSSATR